MDKLLMAQKTKETMKAQHITGAKIVSETGINKSVISGYLKGKRPLTIENLYKVAEFLGISVDYLMGRTAYQRVYQGEEPKRILIDITKGTAIFLPDNPLSANIGSPEVINDGSGNET